MSTSDLAEPWSERWRATWRRPRSLTALVPISGATQDEVHARLEALAPLLEKALKSVGDLHALRLAALPPPENGDGRVRVLFNSVHDDAQEKHLPALMQAAGELLARAFAGANFSGEAADVPELLVWCRAKDQTFHLGAINASVPDILAEQRLLEKIEDLADQRLASGAWNDQTSAETIRREIRAYVREGQAGDDVPRGPAAGVPWIGKLLRLVDIFVTFLLPTIGVLAPHIQKAIGRIRNPVTRTLAWIGYGLWWIYGGIFTLGGLLLVRVIELFEKDTVAEPPDPDKVRRIEADEDRRLKNNVTLWFPIKKSWVRRVLCRLILWGSERGCRHFWTVGALADINTIHYARILQVDDSRTMLFMSDYDGSLDRYLLDFLGVGSNAVIPISSNVDGCPRTRWLFQQDDPVKFGPGWRTMIRRDQLETPVWYCAYPNLSVRDILSNRALRAGLFVEHMREAEAREWTARL